MVAHIDLLYIGIKFGFEGQKKLWDVLHFDAQWKVPLIYQLLVWYTSKLFVTYDVEQNL